MTRIRHVRRTQSTLMKSSTRWNIVLASVILTACVPAPAPVALPFVLITSAPNASPTPTPFQPPLTEELTPTSLYYVQVPTLEAVFPTITPSLTPVLQTQPTPTVDVGALFPTSDAPPPPLPASSQVTPKPLISG